MRISLLLPAAVALASSLCPLARGAETARQILDRAKQLDDTTRHWDDRHQRMKLTITDRRGGERVRELEVYERRYPGDEQKAILFFLAPAEVKGTAFLAFTHRGKPADQWLYLPELKRVRQITANIRNESFVGTDLSYHDLDLITEMPSWTEADARSKLRGEEPIDGTPCHAIELTPQREDIGYKKIVAWLATDDLVARQLEFYGEDAAPVKRIHQSDVQAQGAIPVAHHVHVETLAAGTKTEIDISDVQFNQGLEDDLFTQHRLERGGR
ncbi:MAG TPA: outer membrane lipoprotein-sorting protein [Candidatus Binatia bacterium]|nr:outer membrane lipoprotein-sorting protein [Candidatus Binatia bacterium]